MRPKYSELTATIKGESSARIAERVAAAKSQCSRNGCLNGICRIMRRWGTASFGKPAVWMRRDQSCSVRFLKSSIYPRSYDRIIKVSRTIADLAGTSEIKPEHVAEALSYRNMLPRRS